MSLRPAFFQINNKAFTFLGQLPMFWRFFNESFCQALDKDGNVQEMALDISKAFYRFWHTGALSMDLTIINYLVINSSIGIYDDDTTI